jgi:hypothetical protein
MTVQLAIFYFLAAFTVWAAGVVVLALSLWNAGTTRTRSTRRLPSCAATLFKR